MRAAFGSKNCLNLNTVKKSFLLFQPPGSSVMVMECVKPVVVPPHLIKHFSPPPLTLLTEITVMPLINFSSAS